MSLTYKTLITRDADEVDATGGDVFSEQGATAGEAIEHAASGEAEGGGQTDTGSQGGDREAAGGSEEATGAATGAASGAGKAAPAAGPVALTADQLRELVAGLQPKQQVATAEPAKKLTPEEIDKQLNVFRANEELVGKILAGGPEAVKALQIMLDGVARHAVTVANVINKQEIDRVNSDINPYKQFADEVRAQQARASYLEANPTHAGLEPLIEQVSKDMQASGFKGTKKEVFAEVAKRVDALATQLKIPKADPKAVVTGKGGGGAQKGGTRMSTVATGGQGSAGNPKPGGGSDKDSEASIWE